eukprot:TRINITY_DN15131_c0_g1_i1.p1 TRINITY_DN15131_c0_g1~~TRINITY_DN15131_c0_g1_i1.p1  ORF type:complete len:454 (-),score=87.76 TRINITY_DN15131_c0_g1_i1:154-1515(-)
MKNDIFGIPVTTNSEKAITHINHFYEQVFTYGQKWNTILEAINSDPNCVLAHVLAADFHIARNSREDAVSSLETAKSILNQSTREITSRERLYFSSYWSLIIDGSLPQAQLHLATNLKINPTDLFSLKRSQLYAFVQGDSKEMLAIIHRVENECVGKPYFHSMRAFALEQVGEASAADQDAHYSLEIEPKDVWGHHAILHTHLAEARIEEGIRWFHQHKQLWSDSMSFFYTHMYFHLALFHLESNDVKSAIDIFDTHLWLSQTNDYSKTKSSEDLSFSRNDKTNLQDQLSAINVLWRAEMCSEDPSPLTHRWKDLLSPVLARSSLESSGEGLYDLLVLRLLYANGEKDRAREFQVKLKEWISKQNERKEELENGFLTTIEAIAAENDGDSAKAAQLMGRALPHLAVVGGSVEQRDVLIDFYMQLLLATNQTDTLEQFLQTRPNTQRNARLRKT